MTANTKNQKKNRKRNSSRRPRAVQVVVKNTIRPKSVNVRARDAPSKGFSGSDRVGILHQGEPEMVIPLLPGWTGATTLDTKARTAGWSKWSAPPTIHFRSLTGVASESVVLVKVVQAVSWMQALQRPDLLSVGTDCYTFKACESFNFKLSSVRGMSESLNPFNTENLLTFVVLKVIQPDIMVGEVSLNYSVKFGGRPLKPIAPTFVHVGKDIQITNGTSGVVKALKDGIVFERGGPYELTFVNKDGKGVAAPILSKMIGNSTEDLALMEVNRAPQAVDGTGTMKDRITSVLVNVAEKGAMKLMDKVLNQRAGEGLEENDDPAKPPTVSPVDENFEGTIIINTPGAISRANASGPSGPAVVLLEHSRSVTGKILWILGEVATSIAWDAVSTLVKSYVQGIVTNGVIHKGTRAANYIRWLNNKGNASDGAGDGQQQEGGDNVVPDIPDFGGDPDAPGAAVDWIGTQQYMSVYARHRAYSKADWNGNTYCKGYAATKFKNATYFKPPRLVGVTYRRAKWDEEDKLYVASNLRVDHSLNGTYLLMESYTWGDNSCTRFSEFMPAEAAVYCGSVSYFGGLTACRSVVRIVDAYKFSMLADNILMGMAQLPYEAKASNPEHTRALPPALRAKAQVYSEHERRRCEIEARVPGGGNYFPTKPPPTIGPHLKPPKLHGWNYMNNGALGNYSSSITSYKPIGPMKPTVPTKMPLPSLGANGLATMAKMLPELGIAGAVVAVFGIVAGLVSYFFDVEDIAAINTFRLSAVNSGKIAKAFLANWTRGDSYMRLKRVSYFAGEFPDQYGANLPMHSDIPGEGQMGWQYDTRVESSGRAVMPPADAYPWGWDPKPEWIPGTSNPPEYIYPNAGDGPPKWAPGYGPYEPTPDDGIDLPTGDSNNNQGGNSGGGNTNTDQPETNPQPDTITDPNDLIEYSLDTTSPGFAENYRHMNETPRWSRAELPVRLEAGPIKFMIGSAIDRTNNWFQGTQGESYYDYAVYMTQTSVASEWSWEPGLRGGDSGVEPVNDDTKVPSPGATGNDAQNKWMEDGSVGRVITIKPPQRYCLATNFLCVEIVAQNTVSDQIRFSTPGYTGCEPTVVCRTRGPMIFLRAYGPMDVFSKAHIVVPYDTSKGCMFMQDASDHIYVQCTATCYIVGSEKVAKRWTLFDDENADAYNKPQANIKMYEMRPEGFDKVVEAGKYDLASHTPTQFCFSAYEDGKVMPSCNKVVPQGLESITPTRSFGPKPESNLDWIQRDSQLEPPPEPDIPWIPIEPSKPVKPDPPKPVKGFHEPVETFVAEPIEVVTTPSAPVVRTRVTIQPSLPIVEQYGNSINQMIWGNVINCMVDFGDERGLVPYSTDTRSYTSDSAKYADSQYRMPVTVGVPQLIVSGPLTEPPRLTVVERYKVGPIFWNTFANSQGVVENRMCAVTSYPTIDLMGVGAYLDTFDASVGYYSYTNKTFGHSSPFRLRKCRIFANAFIDQTGVVCKNTSTDMLRRYEVQMRSNTIMVARQVDMVGTGDVYGEVIKHWIELNSTIYQDEHIEVITSFGDFDQLIEEQLAVGPKMVEFSGSLYSMCTSAAQINVTSPSTNNGAWKITTYLDAEPLVFKGFEIPPTDINGNFQTAQEGDQSQNTAGDSATKQPTGDTTVIVPPTDLGPIPEDTAGELNNSSSESKSPDSQEKPGVAKREEDNALGLPTLESSGH